MNDRYDTSTNTEGRYQPGSDDKVLVNKPGITDPAELDQIELELLEDLTVALLDEVTADQQITVADLRQWHQRWLGTLYAWAGEYRTVNMSKDAFPFAASHLYLA